VGAEEEERVDDVRVARLRERGGEEGKEGVLVVFGSKVDPTRRAVESLKTRRLPRGSFESKDVVEEVVVVFVDD